MFAADHHAARPPVVFAVATAAERRAVERSGITDCGAFLVQTGIGPGSIRASTPALLRRRPAGLVSIGVAGGLTAALKPGAVLVPREILAETGERFPVSAAWRERIFAHLPEPAVESGVIVSVARIVRTPADKRGLAEQSGAVAVDMESAELARLARREAIPFLVIRAVADPYDTRIPPAAGRALTRDGAISWTALLAALLRRPGDVGALITLGTAFRSAVRALDACCRQAGEPLCRPDRSRLL